MEVTFDETMPCSSSAFECAGKEEMGESIFMEEQDDEPWGVSDTPPLAAPVDLATSTSPHGPVPTSSTTWGPMEQLPQGEPTVPEEAPAAVEGEATSSREAPRHI